MYQNKKHFSEWSNLYRPLCSVAVLCTSLLVVPDVAFATGIQTTSIITQQQQIVVKGKVVDASGETIIGATILQVGSQSNGAITDIDGNFTIKVPAGTTLEISYIGYITQRVKAQPNLNVTLTEDTKTLDEVIVVGYGTVKKRDLTGAVSSVKSDIVKLTPSANPMEALQGRVAGLDITKSSGQAGTGVSLQLRGNRSITASGKPLFIIDGMPGDYETLNPNDIESIEVLKDASSTAVYGSSGSNGVVIITTKKGEEGKLSVNFNTYLGFNGWSTLPKMNSPQRWLDTRMEARKWAGTIEDDGTVYDEIYQDAVNAGHTIDWVDAMMQTGSTQNYSLSISGGTKTSRVSIQMMNINFILQQPGSIRKLPNGSQQVCICKLLIQRKRKHPVTYLKQ